MLKNVYRCENCHNKIERRVSKETLRVFSNYKEGQRIYCKDCEAMKPVVFIKQIDLDKAKPKGFTRRFKE